MKRALVDLPDPHARAPGAEYIYVGTFDTRSEALEFLARVHGLSEPIAEFFITDEIGLG